MKNLPYPILIASTLHEQAIARRAREELGLPNRLIMLGERCCVVVEMKT